MLQRKLLQVQPAAWALLLKSSLAQWFLVIH